MSKVQKCHEVVEGTIIIRISETDRKILEIIKEKENPGYRAIASALQRNPAVIRRHVKNCLLERGLVESLEGGGWRITSLGIETLQRRQRRRVSPRSSRGDDKGRRRSFRAGRGKDGSSRRQNERRNRFSTHSHGNKGKRSRENRKGRGQ